jgi:hypothetical protein
MPVPTAHGLPLNPFQQEHCECLNRVIESTINLQGLLEDCKNCGLDVSKAIERNGDHQRLATALKAKFFPHAP